jgi:hypothetical protein
MKHLPWHRTPAVGMILLMAAATVTTPAHAGVLDKQKLLDAQTFWDNRDWDWYKQNIPFFESPDPDIDTTYYCRWELVTKHLTYGSPDTGYVYTEFIDRPFWSGRYGAISCPAGHQLYETRWARDPRLSQDYARYWFRAEGAQPRRYSTWLADAVWATHAVRPDGQFVRDLLPDLVRNYEEWERERFDPEVGLFWQTGHDDGMEYNINSRQSEDQNRGAPGYRPTLNAYMWADAVAIERIAKMAGDDATADRFAKKAAGLKENLQKKLWDPKRDFFLHMSRQDEHRDGFKVNALTLTHQTGRFAGSEFGREQIGFVPWQFNLPDPGYERAWQFLMTRDRFFSDYGPTTVERRDPMFRLSPTCCWWSGQSWPYATTQTLVAMANLLNHYKQPHVTKEDYVKLLRTYAKTHRKNGKPYIAEAAHPDTGSWEGHDAYNHSEHYFHSAYADLVITGLAGLRPRADDVIEVNPLVPEAWDYFALDDVAYHGHSVSILWDRRGDRYGRGPGLHVLVNRKKLASSPTVTKLTAELPPAQVGAKAQVAAVNFAVNNDGSYFPRVTASHTGEKTSVTKLFDGNYWYHLHPPNRWTAGGSASATDRVAVDFGVKRPVHTVKLYLLDDGEKVSPPARYELEYWNGSAWAAVPGQTRPPAEPTGRRANVVRFAELQAEKLRVVLTHRPGSRAGLSEFEVWGDAALPVTPAPAPKDNLALNDGTRPFPKASASHTSRYDQVQFANDGVVNFNPAPNNRWTSYESPGATDWLEIDFGEEKEVDRVELALYDDRGGVQAPKNYAVQSWDGREWRDVRDQKKTPEKPAGGQWNEVRFAKVKARKIRVVFTHAGSARSGVTEILVWPN